MTTIHLRPVLLSSTDGLPGYEVVRHPGGIVTSTKLSLTTGPLTMGNVSDLLLSLTEQANEQLAHHARLVGADAVVGLNQSHSVSMQGPQTLITVVVTGTYVSIVPSSH